MGGQGGTTGPDLTQGIAADDVPDGGMVLGHVGDDGVLVARRGNELFAVGASCTHYGGPLAEGLVADGAVRCPWHHACFDLATGEALRAPAFAPIACYDVAVSDGRARVGARRATSPTRTPPAGSPSSVVVVGAGAAGFAAANALSREGLGRQVTMLGAEETGPVDRPNLSKEYLAGKAPEEWIPLAQPEDVELRTGTRVVEVDPGSRSVRLADGSSVPWNALLLDNRADSSAFGFQLQNAAGCTIRGNTVIGARTAAIAGEHSADIRVESNVLLEAPVGVLVSAPRAGGCRGTPSHAPDDEQFHGQTSLVVQHWAGESLT